MALERRLPFGPAHWLNLTGATKEELERLAREYNLSAEMVRDCLDPDHLPKIQRSGSVTFVMLRAFDEQSPLEATSAQAATRKLAIFWGEGFVLTVHRAPMRWLENVYSTWESRATRDGAQLPSLVHDLVEECLYTYEAPIDQAALGIERLEDTIFQSESSSRLSGEILETAYLAKKRATLFKRMLRLTRDLFPSISKLGEPGSPAVESLKEEADRLYFYSDDLVETANDLVQLSISLTSNRTNEIVRILTLVSIFLLPLNVITGIYGMNFRHMPELDWRFGYPLAIGLMLLVEIAVFRLLKKKRWIR